VAELAHPARIRDLLLTKTAGRSDERQAWPRLCILPIWSLTKCRLQTNSRSPRRPRRAADAAGCVVSARRVAGHGRLPRADRRDRRHAQVRQKVLVEYAGIEYAALPVAALHIRYIVNPQWVSWNFQDGEICVVVAVAAVFSAYWIRVPCARSISGVALS